LIVKAFQNWLMSLKDAHLKPSVFSRNLDLSNKNREGFA